jgi:hypothetical protein
MAAPMALPSDEQLNAMRELGDPVVDDLVRAHFDSQPQAVGKLLGQLFSAPGMPAHPLVESYMAALPEVALDDPDRIKLGQSLFDLFGPEVLLILGSCALPLAYAAGNGVQVVARARRLKEDPIRRLCDTAQMVINVMQPDELTHGGIGWVSIRKTRLIHALIRFHTLTQPSEPWPAEYGLPVNQEDLTGTLLAFSIAVLQGLRKIGCRISVSEGNAYLHAWCQIGRMLGLDPTRLPSNEGEAMALALRIGQRQIRATDEGKELSDQLLKAVGSVFMVPGYAANLSRFFLEGSAFGENVAEKLKIPSVRATRWLVSTRAAQKRLELRLLEIIPGARARRSRYVTTFLQQLLKWKRAGSGKVPFEIPARLQLKWGLSHASG